MTRLVSGWFCWKVMPSRTVKQEMARTSSILAAAITRLGIPFATPYPLSCRERRQETTTAGLTAAREKPIMAAQVQGRPRRRWLARQTAEVSIRQGSMASLKTMPDSCLSTCGLRPRQALRRMTTRAVVLVAAYHSGSTPCNTHTLSTLGRSGLVPHLGHVNVGNIPEEDTSEEHSQERREVDELDQPGQGRERESEAEGGEM